MMEQFFFLLLLLLLLLLLVTRTFLPGNAFHFPTYHSKSGKVREK